MEGRVIGAEFRAVGRECEPALDVPGPVWLWRRSRCLVLVLVGAVFAMVSFVCSGRPCCYSLPLTLFSLMDLSPRFITGAQHQFPHNTDVTRNRRRGQTDRQNRQITKAAQTRNRRRGLGFRRILATLFQDQTDVCCSKMTTALEISRR